MSGSTLDPEFVASTGEPLTDAEYRLREAEARLDRRLEALETREARTRVTALVAAAGLVLTLAAVVLMGGEGLPADGAAVVGSLSTSEIVLRDADGIERGKISADAGGGALLSLSDRDGRERIRLTVLADGSPGVTIHDPDEQPRAVLGNLPDGTTNLVFTDRAGDIRTLVGVGPEGEPAMTVYDESGADDETERP